MGKYAEDLKIYKLTINLFLSLAL